MNSIHKKVLIIFLTSTVLAASNAFSAELEGTQQKGRLLAELAGSSNLVVTVDGIRKHQGTIMLAIFNSETGHQSQQAIGAANLPVTAGDVTVEFEGLPEGQYAINLYHDVNGDGQMNSNLFGIPSEPYAFSNNAKGNFGPAKWVDAAFDVTDGQNTHTITIFK